VTWVRDAHMNEPLEYIEHLNGVDWYEAGPPRLRFWPFHRHAAQSRGLMGGRFIERCRCGATRLDHSMWFNG
jgi:hypothetical protein